MEEKRIFQEKEQGRKIQFEADKVWGWGTPAGKFRVKRRLKEFLQRLNLTKKNKVLEIGCGTGIFTDMFYQNGIKHAAVDISFDLLKKAKDRNPDLILIQADAEKLPFKENVFDCVMGVSVLHHLNIKSVLKDIRYVLNKGGLMIFSEPNMANPQIFMQKNINWLKKFMKDTPLETAFFRWKLEIVLRNIGFSNVCICPFEFLHPLTPRFLINFVKKLEYYMEHAPFFKEFAGSLLIISKK